MARGLRITDNVVAIFNTMLERPGAEMYGLQIAEAAVIGTATIYAALTRMERAGMLEARWEDIDPAEVGRPRRRLYRLTVTGAEIGRKAVEDYQPRVRPTNTPPRWRSGASTEPMS
jgi:PadR family transcriptional regulator, regulatory protein PadR